MRASGRHISDHDLDRYYLGMIREERELAVLEEHLLACSDCVARAQQTEDLVDELRVALSSIDDLQCEPAFRKAPRLRAVGSA